VNQRLRKAAISPGIPRAKAIIVPASEMPPFELLEPPVAVVELSVAVVLPFGSEEVDAVVSAEGVAVVSTEVVV